MLEQSRAPVRLVVEEGEGRRSLKAVGDIAVRSCVVQGLVRVEEAGGMICCLEEHNSILAAAEECFLHEDLAVGTT